MDTSCCRAAKTGAVGSGVELHIFQPGHCRSHGVLRPLEMLLFQNAAAKWTVATLKVLLLEVVRMEQLGVKEKKPR